MPVIALRIALVDTVAYTLPVLQIWWKNIEKQKSDINLNIGVSPEVREGGLPP